MECKINDIAVDCSALSYREMTYRSIPAEFIPTTFSLTLTSSEFIAAVEVPYSEFIEDDLEYGTENDEEEIVNLRKRGWPPLQTFLFDDPIEASHFVLEHMRFELLSNLFTLNKPHGEVKHFIDEIQNIEIGEEIVKISGASISRRTDVGHTPS